MCFFALFPTPFLRLKRIRVCAQSSVANVAANVVASGVFRQTRPFDSSGALAARRKAGLPGASYDLQIAEKQLGNFRLTAVQVCGQVVLSSAAAALTGFAKVPVSGSKSVPLS